MMMAGSDAGRRRGLVKLFVILMVMSNLFLFISHSNDGVGFMEVSRLTSQIDKASRRTQLANAYHTGLSDFSTCLLVRERDVAKLPEWLAYHYYALQTRYLVVLPDPSIDSAVNETLNEWRSYLTSVSWTEHNLVESKDKWIRVSRRQNEDEAAFQDRRAASFYHNCAAHMKAQGRGMTSFQQVHEFAAMNEDAVTNSKTLVKEAGSLLRLLQYAQSNQATDSTCVPTYTTPFSTIGSKVEEVQASLPDFLHGQQHLDTVQWRYQKKQPDVAGKAFVNMATLPERHALSVTQYGTIRGRFEFAPYCPTTTPEPLAMFRIHVYPHSDETATSMEATEQDIFNDSVSPWVLGFVNQIGEESARSLLRRERPAGN
jgi:hypothetical protein